MVEKGMIHAPVAEHTMCICLSNKMVREVIIEGYDLYMCTKEQFNIIEVCCTNSEDSSAKLIVDGGFEEGWAKPFYRFGRLRSTSCRVSQ
jgi:hypothetical protein